MAEILLAPGSSGSEDIDFALKRLKKAVGQEGILKIVKRRYFDGAMTKSQRRRQKKLIAKARYLKGRHSEDLSGPDRLKLRLQDSPFYHDEDWITGKETWKPILTPLKPFQISEGQKPWRSFKTDPLSAFGQDKRLKSFVPKEEEDDMLSTHACTIAYYRLRGQTIFPIVRGLNDDGSERHNFQFPGGGKEKWEKTSEETAIREYLEETGKIINITVKDRIFTQVLGNHTFICYLSKIMGGRLCKGKEIVELQFVTYEQLCQLAEAGMLSPKHERAFLNFKAMIEAVKNSSQKEETNV